MTNPPQNPFEHNLFGSAPLGSAPQPPVYSAPPAPPPDRRPANVLATLSVVFAFVFAPVGAILGHLGLRQIRRTGQRGRDRALVGTVLSYTVIIVAVATLVVWLTRPDTPAAHTAAPTTAHPTVAPPEVTPSDLARLIPTLADVKAITGDQTLITSSLLRRPDDRAAGGQTIDRQECRGVLFAGVPDLYNTGALVDYYEPVFVDRNDPSNTTSLDPAVASFPDWAVAQAQLTKMLSAWRQCSGQSVKIGFFDGGSMVLSLSGPTDAGNGISVMEASADRVLSVRAVAAKANVVIDLEVSATNNSVGRARPTVLAIANQILGKIPG